MVSGQQAQVLICILDDPALPVVEQVALQDALDHKPVSTRILGRTPAAGDERCEYFELARGRLERPGQEAAFGLQESMQLLEHAVGLWPAVRHAAAISNAAAAAAIVRLI
jgi:hypothetical protein